MKLKKAKVTNYKSIIDSTDVELNSITCLIGKNEAGKTAFLKALEGFKPTNEQHTYSVLNDYPRQYRSTYKPRHKDKDAQVIVTIWELEENDRLALVKEFGEEAIKSNEVTLSKTYNQSNYNGSIEIEHSAVLKYLCKRFNLTDAEAKAFEKSKTTKVAFNYLSKLKQPSTTQQELLEHLRLYRANCATLKAIDILSLRIPYFIYISDYTIMSDKISFSQIRHDIQNEHGTVKPSDQIFLNLLELGETNIDELEQISNSKELIARCEAISDVITSKVFSYWSLNNSLGFKLTVATGWLHDPAPFNAGAVACAYIVDKSNNVELILSERSAGFIWFFTILVRIAQYGEDIILLMDEPGLTIHGAAQKDLLRYFEEVIGPKHQLIYSTHSPFMVPLDNFSRVRTVEFVEANKLSDGKIIEGTRVIRSISAKDSVANLPILSALGIELTQNFLIGRNTLLVEGTSDLDYLQAFSAHLCAAGRQNLDPSWAVCPVGGIGKFSGFISLFKGNSLNTVVLTDYEPGQRQALDNIYKLMGDKFVIKATDIVNKSAADIEDFFEPKFYFKLINDSYSLDGGKALNVDEVRQDDERVTKKVKRHFESISCTFRHEKPSQYLLSNTQILKEKTEEVTKTVNRFEVLFKKIAKLIVDEQE